MIRYKTETKTPPATRTITLELPVGQAELVAKAIDENIVWAEWEGGMVEDELSTLHSVLRGNREPYTSYDCEIEPLY